MRRERFFVEEALDGATSAVLAGEEARHLGQVLRKAVGDEVEVFDGRGFVARARVTALARNEAELDLEEVRHDERRPVIDISLCVALPRGGAADDVLRRAVETGASRITPLKTVRSVHRAERKDAERRAARFRKIAIAALKQCGRNVLPILTDTVSLSDLSLEDELGLYGATRSGAETLRAFERRTFGFPARVRAVVGPEGGLTLEEEAVLEGRGFHGVGLGPQILRVEIAVVAITTFLAAVTEDELRS